MANESPAHCPNCSEQLKKRPQRKTKCPHCGEYIYLKSTPDNREKRLMTYEQANDADEQWEDYHSRQSVVKAAYSYDIPESMAESMTMREMLKYAIGKGTSHQKLMAFHALAIEDDRDGIDFSSNLKRHYYWSLKHLSESGLPGMNHVRIVAGEPHPCKEALRLDGAVFDIAAALKDMPLPPRECTRTALSDRPGFCACRYEPVFDDEIDAPTESRAARGFFASLHRIWK